MCQSDGFRILVINPTPRSTRVALFAGRDELAVQMQAEADHTAAELSTFDFVWDQYLFRKERVTSLLDDRGVGLQALSAVVGVGGLLRPTPGGTYSVGHAMLEDLRRGALGEHVSNLGGALAYGLARTAGIPAFVVDPPTTDELAPVAAVTGLPQTPHHSVVHALSMRYAARRGAADLGLPYDQARLVVAHLGAGISVAAHVAGAMVDATNALEGGPFSPERAGRLPSGNLVRLCFSGRYTERELVRLLTRGGGLQAHLGTGEMAEAERRLQQGDTVAALVLEAMAHQVAKEIGAMAAAMGSRPDGAILTGPVAGSQPLVAWIAERVEWIAPLLVYPGDDEMRALAEGAFRVLAGKEEARVYA